MTAPKDGVTEGVYAESAVETVKSLPALCPAELGDLHLGNLHAILSCVAKILETVLHLRAQV